MFEQVWNFIKNRLKEKSTLVSVVGVVAWVVGYFGFALDTEAMAGLTALIGGVFALVLGATKVKGSED